MLCNFSEFFIFFCAICLLFLHFSHLSVYLLTDTLSVIVLLRHALRLLLSSLFLLFLCHSVTTLFSLLFRFPHLFSSSSSIFKLKITDNLLTNIFFSQRSMFSLFLMIYDTLCSSDINITCRCRCHICGAFIIETGLIIYYYFLFGDKHSAKCLKLLPDHQIKSSRRLFLFHGKNKYVSSF